jgi:hypothetical protein
MSTMTRCTTVLLTVGLACAYVTSSAWAATEPAPPPAPEALPSSPMPAASPAVLPSTGSARLDDLQRSLEMAKRASKVASSRAAAGTGKIWFSNDASASGSLLLVPSGQPQEGQITQIREDLGIMARIMTDRLRQADLNPDEGQVFWGGQRSIRALYLAGFGAVFVTQMDFPLLPSQEAKKAPAEETSDEVWAKAKQTLLAPGSADNQDKQRPEFDPAKVATLKETLITAIKHATNIRAVTANESVAVVVMGGSRENGTAIGFGMDPFGHMAGGAGEGSVLVIKAAKADIDALAKGQLDLAGFRNKVLTVAY